MSSSERYQRTDTLTDPSVVLARFREATTEIKRREVQRAVRELEASDDLSDHDRAVVEEMADRIVSRLLEPPSAALEDGEYHADPDQLQAIAHLLEPGTVRDSSE